MPTRNLVLTDHQEKLIDNLVASGDVKGTIVSFMKSPEYMGKNKSDWQVITDLYKGVLGRTPSNEEVSAQQRQIAQAK